MSTISSVVSEDGCDDGFIWLEEDGVVFARTFRSVSGTTILTVNIIIDKEKYPNFRNR
jgi:hypothetical protein